MFASEDSGRPFTQYLTEGILPQKHSERYKLKRLATRYFLHNAVLFKKGYDGDPLRCLGLKEAEGMIQEVHSGECEEYQGKKKLYRCLLQMGYYWPTMKKDMTEFVKKMPQLPSTGQLDSHSSTKLTQHGHPMALPHLGA